MARRSPTHRQPPKRGISLQSRQPKPAERSAVSALTAMPRIELPAGATRVEVTDADVQSAAVVRDWTYPVAVQAARTKLRQGRKLQRRGAARPAGKTGRGGRELAAAREQLIAAGLCCGVAELLRHELTPSAERIAGIRERCSERLEEEIGRYAVDVTNWISDLAGEPRLTRG